MAVRAITIEDEAEKQVLGMAGHHRLDDVIERFIERKYALRWTYWPLFALVGIGIPLAILLYYSSVGAVYVLGELIKNSFDRYRHLILTSFGLKIPDTLREEQIIWVRLAAFIRRGDEFYFPTEFKEPKS